MLRSGLRVLAVLVEMRAVRRTARTRGAGARIHIGLCLLGLSTSACMPSLRYDRALPGGVSRAKPTALPDAPWIDVPLTIHYATEQGMTEVTPEAATAGIERANAALMPYGIRLFISEKNILPQGYARIEDDDARFALAELSHQNGTIHLFFVGGVKLASSRPEKTRVSGMHWRYRGMQTPMHRREYIVVAKDAPDTTLVHEVGHALGLGHSDAPDNLMCSCQRTGLSRFNAKQGRRMRAGARLLLLRANP